MYSLQNLYVVLYHSFHPFSSSRISLVLHAKRLLSYHTVCEHTARPRIPRFRCWGHNHRRRAFCRTECSWSVAASQNASSCPPVGFLRGRSRTTASNHLRQRATPCIAEQSLACRYRKLPRSWLLLDDDHHHSHCSASTGWSRSGHGMLLQKPWSESPLDLSRSFPFDSSSVSLGVVVAAAAAVFLSSEHPCVFGHSFSSEAAWSHPSSSGDCLASEDLGFDTFLVAKHKNLEAQYQRTVKD